MSGGEEHVREAKSLLGFTLGRNFHHRLDRGTRQFQGAHREIDHSFEQVENIALEYGVRGRIEFIHHLALDYGLIKPVRNKRRKATKDDS
jgi:hypothetical protein